MKRYRLVACGGTFDRLHQGHKKFLDFVLNLSDKVVIGLTSDKYIQQHKNNLGIESFEVRKQTLEHYLKSIDKGGVVETISIDDHLGPSVTEEYKFDAIVLTKDTLKGGEEINRERVEKGFSPLQIEVFKLTLDEDGVAYSSTRIRNNLLLSPTLRPLLQDPWGEILDEIPLDLDTSRIVTVGDVTTKKFMEKNLIPQLSIVDFLVERKPIEKTTFKDMQVVKVKNPAGTISKELFDTVEVALKPHPDPLLKGEGSTTTVIVVDGEEDLAVLPVLICAPIGFTVFYGQFGQGLVRVHVTEEIKNKAKELLEQFTPS